MADAPELARSRGLRSFDSTLGYPGEGPRPRASRPPVGGRGADVWARYAAEPPRGLLDGEANELLVHAVTDNTNAAHYLPRLREFVEWMQALEARRGPLNDDELDPALADHLAEMCYHRRRHVQYGRTLLAAMAHVFPDVGTKAQLPLAHRALKAWSRLGQDQQGEGFSPETWGALLRALLTRGEVESAVIVAISVDCYLRGQDWRQLRARDVQVASGQMSIALGVAERGETTKTGQTQGVVVSRPWVRVVLAWWIDVQQIAPGELVFAKARRTFDDRYHRALADLGMEWVGPPHSMRHAGATIDFLLRAVPLGEVQLRGRWEVPKSVRRYTKPHLLVAHNARVPPGLLRRGSRFMLDPLTSFARSLPQEDAGRATLLARAASA